MTAQQHARYSLTGGWASDIAANVRAEAAGRGYKQTDLAEFLHQDRSTVGLKWRGIRDWSLGDLEALAGLFRITPWELVQVDARTRARRDSNPQPADP